VHFVFERDWHHCLNESHVFYWKLVKICRENTEFVYKDEELGLEGLQDERDGRTFIN
jgi:hypothetical protein